MTSSNATTVSSKVAFYLSSCSTADGHDLIASVTLPQQSTSPCMTTLVIVAGLSGVVLSTLLVLH